MRKTFLVVSALSCLAVASTAFAQGFVPLAPIPGLTDETSATAVLNSKSFATFFNYLYKYAIGLSAVLAVIMIIWGGLEISTQDSVSSHAAGKERIQQAILGLVLVLSPALVFSIINPSILNLSLSLGRLDLKCNGGSCAINPATTPYIQNSVQPGSLRAIYNGQLIGFQENAYASPQTNTYCIQLKDGSTPDGKNYFCARDPNGCRMMFNEICQTGTTVVSCADGQGSRPVQQPCVKY